MFGQALRFGQILAGTDFSPSDAAVLRAELIAYFKKKPANQMEAYESVAKEPFVKAIRRGQDFDN